MKNAAKGKGYTIRVGGKKCLATSILEEQVEAAQRQFEELQQRNAQLRAKEAMQLEALEGWEAVLQQFAAVPDNATIDEDRAARLVSAAMLDMQALSLKQELRPTQTGAKGSTASAPAVLGSSLHTSHRSSTTVGGPMTSSDPAIITENGKSNSAAASSSTSSGSGSTSSSSLSTESLCAESNTRLAAVMALVDVAVIPELKQLTLEEIAGRVRCAVDKVRAARQQAEDPMSDGAVVAAMREYAKLCFGHYIANDTVHMRLHSINMETLQPEFPSEEHVEGVVRAVQLQPQQEQQICVGFHTNRKSEAKLMKKQQKVQQQLQALLMPAEPPTDAGTSSAQAMETSSSQQQQQQQQQHPEGLPPGAEASTPGAAGHSVRDKAGALLAVVSGGQQGLSPGDLAWLTKAGVDAGGKPQQTKELAAAGCLPVQAATNAEALLEQLSKLVHAQKQQLRALTMMWINLLTPEQQAAAVIAAYPFMLHHPRLCAKVASMSAEKEQK